MDFLATFEKSSISLGPFSGILTLCCSQLALIFSSLVLFRKFLKVNMMMDVFLRRFMVRSNVFGSTVFLIDLDSISFSDVKRSWHHFSLLDYPCGDIILGFYCLKLGVLLGLY